MRCVTSFFQLLLALEESALAQAPEEKRAEEGENHEAKIEDAGSPPGRANGDVEGRDDGLLLFGPRRWLQLRSGSCRAGIRGVVQVVGGGFDSNRAQGRRGGNEIVWSPGGRS